MSELNANTVGAVQTAAAIHGAATGFAELSAQYLYSLTAADPKGGPSNPNATVITNDASAHIALAGALTVDQPVPVSGFVDQTFQP